MMTLFVLFKYDMSWEAMVDLILQYLALKVQGLEVYVHKMSTFAIVLKMKCIDS